MAEVGLNLQLVAGGLGDRVAAQLIPEIAALLMPGNHTGPLESGDSYGLDQFGLSPAPRRDRGGFAGLGIGVDKLYALTRDGFASEGGGQLPSTLQPLTYGAARSPNGFWYIIRHTTIGDFIDIYQNTNDAWQEIAISSEISDPRYIGISYDADDNSIWYVAAADDLRLYRATLSVDGQTITETHSHTFTAAEVAAWATGIGEDTALSQLRALAYQEDTPTLFFEVANAEGGVETLALPIAWDSDTDTLTAPTVEQQYRLGIENIQAAAWIDPNALVVANPYRAYSFAPPQIGGLYFPNPDGSYPALDKEKYNNGHVALISKEGILQGELYFTEETDRNVGFTKLRVGQSIGDGLFRGVSTSQAQLVGFVGNPGDWAYYPASNQWYVHGGVGWLVLGNPPGWDRKYGSEQAAFNGVPGLGSLCFYPHSVYHVTEFTSHLESEEAYRWQSTLHFDHFTDEDRAIFEDLISYVGIHSEHDFALSKVTPISNIFSRPDSRHPKAVAIGIDDSEVINALSPDGRVGKTNDDSDSLLYDFDSRIMSAALATQEWFVATADRKIYSIAANTDEFGELINTITALPSPKTMQMITLDPADTETLWGMALSNEDDEDDGTGTIEIIAFPRTATGTIETASDRIIIPLNGVNPNAINTALAANDYEPRSTMWRQRVDGRATLGAIGIGIKADYLYIFVTANKGHNLQTLAIPYRIEGDATLRTLTVLPDEAFSVSMTGHLISAIFLTDLEDFYLADPYNINLYVPKGKGTKWGTIIEKPARPTDEQIADPTGSDVRLYADEDIVGIARHAGGEAEEVLDINGSDLWEETFSSADLLNFGFTANHSWHSLIFRGNHLSVISLIGEVDGRQIAGITGGVHNASRNGETWFLQETNQIVAYDNGTLIEDSRFQWTDDTDLSDGPRLVGLSIPQNDEGQVFYLVDNGTHIRIHEATFNRQGQTFADEAADHENLSLAVVNSAIGDGYLDITSFGGTDDEGVVSLYMEDAVTAWILIGALTATDQDPSRPLHAVALRFDRGEGLFDLRIDLHEAGNDARSFVYVDEGLLFHATDSSVYRYENKNKRALVSYQHLHSRPPRPLSSELTIPSERQPRDMSPYDVAQIARATASEQGGAGYSYQGDLVIFVVMWIEQAEQPESDNFPIFNGFGFTSQGNWRDSREAAGVGGIGDDSGFFWIGSQTITYDDNGNFTFGIPRIEAEFDVRYSSRTDPDSDNPAHWHAAYEDGDKWMQNRGPNGTYGPLIPLLDLSPNAWGPTLIERNFNLTGIFVDADFTSDINIHIYNELLVEVTSRDSDGGRGLVLDTILARKGTHWSEGQGVGSGSGWYDQTNSTFHLNYNMYRGLTIGRVPPGSNYTDEMAPPSDQTDGDGRPWRFALYMFFQPQGRNSNADVTGIAFVRPNSNNKRFRIRMRGRTIL